MKGRNEGTSVSETDMTVVNLPYQKLKSWHKLRLEVTILKWTDSQRVAIPQKHTGLTVAAEASLSVSQAEIFFLRGANTAMKMNGAIVGDSATRWGGFTARKRAALIGFCDVETQKPVQNIWKKIEKARDATEVRIIVVTASKEQKVDVDK